LEVKVSPSPCIKDSRSEELRADRAIARARCAFRGFSYSFSRPLSRYWRKFLPRYVARTVHVAREDSSSKRRWKEVELRMSRLFTRGSFRADSVIERGSDLVLRSSGCERSSSPEIALPKAGRWTCRSRSSRDETLPDDAFESCSATRVSTRSSNYRIRYRNPRRVRVDASRVVESQTSDCSIMIKMDGDIKMRKICHIPSEDDRNNNLQGASFTAI